MAQGLMPGVLLQALSESWSLVSVPAIMSPTGVNTRGRVPPTRISIASELTHRLPRDREKSIAKSRTADRIRRKSLPSKKVRPKTFFAIL